MSRKLNYTPTEPVFGNYRLTLEGEEISVEDVQLKYGEILSGIRYAQESFSELTHLYTKTSEGEELTDGERVSLEGFFNMFGFKIDAGDLLTAILKALSAFFMSIIKGLQSIGKITVAFFKWLSNIVTKNNDAERDAREGVLEALKQIDEDDIETTKIIFTEPLMGSKLVDLSTISIEGNPGSYFKYLEGVIERTQRYLEGVMDGRIIDDLTKSSDEVCNLVKELEVMFKKGNAVGIEDTDNHVNKISKVFYDSLLRAFPHVEGVSSREGLRRSFVPAKEQPLLLNANYVFISKVGERELAEGIRNLSPGDFKFERTIGEELKEKRAKFNSISFKPSPLKGRDSINSKKLENLQSTNEKNNAIMEISLASIISNTLSKEEYPNITFLVDMIMGREEELISFVQQMAGDQRLLRRYSILRLLVENENALYDLLRVSAGQRPNKPLPESAEIYEKNVEQFFKLARKEGYFRDVEVEERKRPEQKEALKVVESLLKVVIANQYNLYNGLNNFLLLDCIRPLVNLREAYVADLNAYTEALNRSKGN